MHVASTLIESFNIDEKDKLTMRAMLFLCLSLIISISSLAQNPSAKDAELYFISPNDGDTVNNPIAVRFGLVNMGVAPAGVDVKNTGHHHLLIDTDLPALDKPILKDDNHRHFGKGQTETKLELTPGEHTLQLLLGDLSHIPHNPPVKSQKITINVR